jgi:hypothetical protein
MDPDSIFSRFRYDTGTLSDGTAVGYGAHAALTPIEGLYLGASVVTDTSNTSAGAKLTEVYKGIQVALGYKIADIGHIRAGFFGIDNDWVSPDQAYSLIQVAFGLDAVPGLGFDIGFTYPLAKYSGQAQAPMQVNAGYSIGMIEKLDISGIIQAHFAGAESFADFMLNLQVNPSYQITDSVSAGADINFKMVSDTTSTMGFGFAPYVQLAYANGSFRGGVAVKVPVNAGENLKLYVPLMLTYWF